MPKFRLRDRVMTEHGEKTVVRIIEDRWDYGGLPAAGCGIEYHCDGPDGITSHEEHELRFLHVMDFMPEACTVIERWKSQGYNRLKMDTSGRIYPVTLSADDNVTLLPSLENGVILSFGYSAELVAVRIMWGDKYE